MSNSIITFGEAIELCKAGTPVACTNMRSNEFICLTPETQVTADKLWNAHNRAAAEANNGWLNVHPYFLKTNVYSTVPYTPTNEDIFKDWVVATTRRVCTGIEITDDTINMEFKPYTEEQQNGFYPFWLVYSNLNMAKGVFIFISNDEVSSNKLEVLVNAMYNEYATRSNSLESISFDFKQPTPNFDYAIRGIHLPAKDANLKVTIEDKLRDLYDAGFADINIIIDYDSMVGIGFNGSALHDHVVKAVTEVESDFPYSWTNMSLDNPLGDY